MAPRVSVASRAGPTLSTADGVYPARCGKPLPADITGRGLAVGRRRPPVGERLLGGRRAYGPKLAGSAARARDRRLAGRTGRRRGAGPFLDGVAGHADSDRRTEPDGRQQGAPAAARRVRVPGPRPTLFGWGNSIDRLPQTPTGLRPPVRRGRPTSSSTCTEQVWGVPTCARGPGVATVLVPRRIEGVAPQKGRASAKAAVAPSADAVRR
jgi:hypothetical protein